MDNINYILKVATNYEATCVKSLLKLAYIKKMPNGKYRVLSEKGKNLGTYKSRNEAKDRLKQVEFFKHQDDSSADDEDTTIDLMGAIDFSYSAIMREMRQHASKEQLRQFLIFFKKEFDQAVREKFQKPEKIALQNSLIKFNKKHKIKVKKKLVKNAAVSELGDAAQVGKYLADIVRFTLNRIPVERRAAAIQNLKQKFYSFNANEIAQKDLPPTSALGQSITFVKHVLFNHDAFYIRDVLNNLVKNL